jgi:hypothetical protein
MGRAARGWVVIVILVQTGCYRPDFEALDAGATDGVGGTDVHNPADGAPPSGCNGVELFADDFSGSSLSDAWQVVIEAGGAASVAVGALALTSDGAPGSGVEVRSERYFDLRERAVTIELTQPPPPGPASLEFGVLQDLDDSVGILSAADGITAVQTLAGVPELLGGTSVPAARWLRIRSSGGALVWEAAATSEEWVELATRPSPIALDLRTVASSAPFEARLDTLNGGTPSGAYCKSSALVDDFDAPSPIWKRQVSEPDCVAATLDGHGMLSYSGSTNAACTFRSAAAFDLRGDAVYARVEPAELTLDLYTSLVLFDEGDDFVKLEVGPLGVWCTWDGTANACLGSSFNVANNPYWRIREEDSRLYFEVGPNPGALTGIGSAPVPPDLDVGAVDVALYLRRGSGTTTISGTARFDSVNTE